MTDLKKGDKAHAMWGGGEVKGTVAEVKTDGPLNIESKGKTVSKTGDSKDAAVHLKRSGNDVVKKDSELTKDADGGGSKSPAKKDEHKDDAKAEDKSSGKKESEAETGDKRKKEEPAKKAATPKKAKTEEKKDGKKEDSKKEDSKKEDSKKEDAKKDEKKDDKKEAEDGKKKPAGRPKKGESNGTKARKDVPPTTRTTRSASGKSQS